MKTKGLFVPPKFNRSSEEEGPVLIRNKLSQQQILVETMSDAISFIYEMKEKTAQEMNDYWVQSVSRTDIPLDEIHKFIEERMDQWEIVGTGEAVKVLYLGNKRGKV